MMLKDSELAERLRLHGQWLDSVGESGQRANLHGIDLRNIKNVVKGEIVLAEAELIGVDLSGLDLSGANFRDTDLSAANLEGTNLSMAYLSRCSMEDTWLAGANLTGANLKWVRFNEASLENANLTKANLTRAHLINVNTKGTNVSQATTGYTVFEEIDFRGFSGLESVTHQYPSIIGVDSLKKSNGTIPHAFLRGCGYNDWEVEQLKLYRSELNNQELIDVTYQVLKLRGLAPFKFYSCFISYSHQDKAFALRLHDLLQSKGIRCWLDEHSMLPGDDIYEGIDAGIRESDKIILCCSQHSLTSWWVDNEISLVFEKERKSMKQNGNCLNRRALIPIDIDGYIFDSWESGKKAQLLTRAIADFKGWNSDGFSFDEKTKRVISALRVDDAKQNVQA